MISRKQEYIFPLKIYLTHLGEYVFHSYQFTDQDNFELNDIINPLLDEEFDTEYEAEKQKNKKLDKFDFLEDFNYKSCFIIIDLIKLFDYYNFKESTIILSNLVNVLGIDEDEKIELFYQCFQNELLIIQMKNKLRNLNEYAVNDLEIKEIINLINNKAALDYNLN